jgi:hypothetical protein
MQIRARVRRLIDELPDGELPAVEQFLKQRRSTAKDLPPVLANAEEDDEPTTPDEELAVAQAYADLAAGRVVSHEEARRRLLGQP